MRKVSLSKWIKLLAGMVLVCCNANAQPDTLEVLHWWKSTSEQKAVDVLAAALVEENIQWREALIPSGSGMAAMIVLKSRVLAGDAPDVAQLNGMSIGEWADLDMLLNLDTEASNGKWNKLLFPTIAAWIRPRGHVVVAPLGIHRINTLFFNSRLLAQNKLEPPQNWDEFERVATQLQKAGIPALAQSSEPWQVATLFESLVLAESGADYYRDIFVKKDPAAFSDARFAHALDRLRTLKKWISHPVQDNSWIDVAHQFADGGAAMMIMGDWAKGELNSWGLVTDGTFGCTAVPGTANLHLYDIDTLAMFTTEHSRLAAQHKLAQIVMSEKVQNNYNQVKGSIPVLRKASLSNMDSCSRVSWKVFSRGKSAQVPSFTHRMATDETSRDTLITELHRYFMDDQITTLEEQSRFVSISRILTKIGSAK